MGDLKPGWKRVKFGDVVRLNKEKSKDPEADGLERYVGLEHIEPGDLKVRAWGDVSDGTTFTNRFGPGRVLFGKRRAYQRKVAVADFEGVCSGDIYVLEPKDPTTLLPGLLPYICQTDAFFAHAVGTSAGSLSPRTNWKSLADYEFPLPPLSEQDRLVALLDAASELVDSSLAALNAAEAVQQASLAELYGDWSNLRRLEDVCSKTITYGIVQAGPHLEDGVPYIRVSDMTGVDSLTTRGMLRTSKRIAEKYDRSLVREGDLVVALRGVAGHCHAIPRSLDGANLTQGTARVAVSDEHDSSYVLWALRSVGGRRELRRFMRGWKGEALLEITLTDLRRVRIPIPSLQRQRAIASTANDLEAARISAKQRHQRSRDSRDALVHAALCGGPT